MLNATVYTHKIPPKVRSAMCAFTGSDCLLVEHRQKGKTGSGKKLNCHRNVKHWVEKLGGEQIYGWVLTRNRDLLNRGAYIWIFHSIWKTPENKLADVTMNPLYDNLDLITFWTDSNRSMNWNELISYNNVEVYENNAIAEHVSNIMKYSIAPGKVYWGNNGLYMTLEEDDGTYKIVTEAREQELTARFGVRIEKEGDKLKFVGAENLSAEQKKEMLMKYGLSRVDQ